MSHFGSVPRNCNDISVAHQQVIHLHMQLRVELHPATTVLVDCRSFQLLDDIVDMASEGDGTARERVPGCLQFTLANIQGFENCILTALGFEPVLAT